MPENFFSQSEARIISKLTWRIMPFLFLLYIIAYIDRINVGFAALQMQQQLGFSDAVYGAGAGVFFTGYMLFQVPSNWMSKRWARPLDRIPDLHVGNRFLLHDVHHFR